MALERRPRSATDRFDVVKMYECLCEYARVKDLGWDFEMAAYSKTKRSQGPDREGLQHYHVLLGQIVRFSPNGIQITAC